MLCTTIVIIFSSDNVLGPDVARISETMVGFPIPIKYQTHTLRVQGFRSTKHACDEEPVTSRGLWHEDAGNTLVNLPQVENTGPVFRAIRSLIH